MPETDYEEEGPDLETSIRLKPDQGLLFLAWNQVRLVMNTELPIEVRHPAQVYLEKLLRPYWDAIWEKGMRAIVEKAKTIPRTNQGRDEIILGLRFQETRMLMARQRLDGERNVVYADND